MIESVAGEAPTREAAHASLRTELFVWGRNECGQLGLGSTFDAVDETAPRHLRYSVCIVDVACGAAHTLLLSELGCIYGMGNNGDGQLGLGDVNRRSTPTLLSFSVEERCFLVAAGERHSLAYTALQRIYAFGCNAAGQLGLGDVETRFVPTVQPSAEPISVEWLSAGANSSALVDAQGALWLWGSNAGNKLGFGTDCEMALCRTRLEFGSAVKQVACGTDNTLLLDDEGFVFSLGLSSENGVVEKLREIEGVKRVFCGDSMAALTLNGNLFLWNAVSRNPQILEGFENRILNVAFGQKLTLLLDNDCNVYMRATAECEQLKNGENEFCRIDAIAQPITAVFCGDDFAVCLASPYSQSSADVANRKKGGATNSKFQKSIPQCEVEELFATQLAELRALLKFDNANLLFLAERARVVGERVAGCRRAVDAALADYPIHSQSN